MGFPALKSIDSAAIDLCPTPQLSHVPVVSIAAWLLAFEREPHLRVREIFTSQGLDQVVDGVVPYAVERASRMVHVVQILQAGVPPGSRYR